MLRNLINDLVCGRAIRRHGLDVQYGGDWSKSGKTWHVFQNLNCEAKPGSDLHQGYGDTLHDAVRELMNKIR